MQRLIFIACQVAMGIVVSIVAIAGIAKLMALDTSIEAAANYTAFHFSEPF